MVRVYKEILKSFLKDKTFMFFLVLTAVLSFGFAITNPTMGIDDFSIDRYVNEPFIIAQGRWGTWLLYNILGIRSFTPFWLDLITVIVLAITAILICALFKKVSENKIKKTSYVILACGCISFPIIVNFFVYQSTNLAVAISNLLVVIAFMMIENNFCKNNHFVKYIPSLIILLFSFACYEACFQTALVLVFSILMISLRYRRNVKENKIKVSKKDKKAKEENKRQNKELRKSILRWLGITLGILVFEYLINRLNLFFIGKVFELNNINIHNESSFGSTFEILQELGLGEFFVYLIYRIKGTLEFSNILAFEVLGSSIACIILSIYDSVKNKNKHMWWIWILILISNLLFFFYLKVVLFRTYFSMCVTFGIILLYINEIICDKKGGRIDDKVLQRIFFVFIGFIILLNTKEVNNLFYKDYIGYERDKNYYQSLALKINELDHQKPLLIVKGEKQDYNIVLNNYPDVRRNVSELYFGAFGKKNNEEFLKIFNSLGYTYSVVSEEKYDEYLEDFKKKNISEKVFDAKDYIAVIIDY